MADMNSKVKARRSRAMGRPMGWRRTDPLPGSITETVIKVYDKLIKGRKPVTTSVVAERAGTGIPQVCYALDRYRPGAIDKMQKHYER